MAFTDFIGLIIYLALKIDFATLLDLNSVKHNSTVYPMQVHSAPLISFPTLIFRTRTA